MVFPASHDFFGDSEMGTLMRTIDWGATSLGPVSAWPLSLQTAVRLCLYSRFPVLISCASIWRLAAIR